jgi:hypothetical protein
VDEVKAQLNTAFSSVKRWRRLNTALFYPLFILAICDLPASAQSPRPTEFQVKAAYLYNFGKFVRWPESASSRQVFTMCVFGNDPFDGALQQVTDGQKVNGLSVEVRQVTALDEIKGCRVLFINGEEPGWRSGIATAKKLSVLTVGDAPDFLERGGMIQFVLIANRVRFEVNLDAAREAGLQLSAELLKVAAKVVAQNSPGGQR